MEDRLKNQPRILLINDMAGYGNVALSVMIPVFSHMKYETFNLPTVLISNTLDYGNFDILDTTEYMQNTLRVWNELQFSFDAICTGFIVSERQASLVYEYCKEQRKKGTLVFIDPIMGDDGTRYNGVTNESVTYMKKLCSVADVIIPNITEACFLSGHVIKTSCTKFEMKDIADRLHELGAKAVVITSANIDGKMFTVVKNSLHSEMTLIPYEEIPVRFPGTGDVFMAIVVGHYLRSGKLSESVQTAMHQLEKIIRSSINNTDKYKGIPIEQFLEDIQL